MIFIKTTLFKFLAIGEINRFSGGFINIVINDQFSGGIVSTSKVAETLEV